MNNPDSAIANQIPEAMGEFSSSTVRTSISSLGEGRSERIKKEAIYNVLGLRVLETAIEKSQGSKEGDLTKEFNSHADTGTQKMLDNLNDLEEQITEHQNESKQLSENRAALEDENSNIEKKLEPVRRPA